MGRASFLERPPEDQLAIAAEALAVAREAVGEDDPFVFNVYEDYALALTAMDMPDSAAALHQSLLEKRERVFGPDHPDVAYSLFNLGRIMGRGQGRWEESLPLLERAIAIRERAYGADHPRVADALHTYAIAVANLGEFDRSADLLERSIAIGEATADKRDLGLLDSMELLAQLRALQGRSEDALDLLETLVDRGWWHDAVLDGSPMNSIRDDPRFQRLSARRPAEGR